MTTSTNSQEQMMTRTNDRNKAVRDITLCSIRKIDDSEDSRKFHLSFSSEEPYERWWGTEILSHDEGACDLSRLNEIGVLLFNHDTDRVIGKIIKAWDEDGRGEADVEFDTDADSETIYQKVKSGTLKGVSVGYTVSEWEDVNEGHKSSDGKYEGPCSIARKWTALEVSVVSVPADATVGVGRSTEETKGVSSLYLNERQLQINHNLLQEV